MKKAAIYQVIYQELVKRILAGEWSGGALLPTEAALAAQYGVSRITSRHALTLLADNGYIRRTQGKGSVVVEEKRKTPILGLALTGFDALFGTDFIKGVFGEAEEQGYLVLMQTGYTTPEHEGRCLRRLQAAGVEGIISVPMYDSLHYADELELLTREIPMVFADRRVVGVNVPLVCTDNSQSMQQLYRHLRACGYRRIAFISSRPDSTAVADRMRGYQQAAAPGRDGGKRLMLTTLRSPLPGMDNADSRAYDMGQIEDFLLRNREVEAVIAHTYKVALLVRETAERIGLRVPQDLAIVCFDAPRGVEGDQPFAHIRQNEYEIGAKAVQHLLDIIGGRPVPDTTYVSAVFVDGRSYLQREP